MKTTFCTALFVFLCLLSACGYAQQHYDGIDVSHHNGNIDWTRVAKDTNLQFVYIKATQGGSWQDTAYAKNLKGARANGLKVGTYHFFTMKASAYEQFSNFKKVVPKDQQDLVPMIDIECRHNKWGAHIDSYYARSAKHCAAVAKRLIELVRLIEDEYGCKPIIYCNPSTYNRFLKGRISGYHYYVGDYRISISEPEVPNHTIWQYSENGHIRGIPKPCDLARFSPRHGIEDISISKGSIAKPKKTVKKTNRKRK